MLAVSSQSGSDKDYQYSSGRHSEQHNTARKTAEDGLKTHNFITIRSHRGTTDLRSHGSPRTLPPRQHRTALFRGRHARVYRAPQPAPPRAQGRERVRHELPEPTIPEEQRVSASSWKRAKSTHTWASGLGQGDEERGVPAHALVEDLLAAHAFRTPLHSVGGDEQRACRQGHEAHHSGLPSLVGRRMRRSRSISGAEACCGCTGCVHLQSEADRGDRFLQRESQRLICRPSAPPALDQTSCGRCLVHVAAAASYR